VRLENSCRNLRLQYISVFVQMTKFGYKNSTGAQIDTAGKFSDEFGPDIHQEGPKRDRTFELNFLACFLQKTKMIIRLLFTFY